MATNLGAKSAEIGDTPSFLGLALHNGWQDGKTDRRVNSAEVLSMVDFGSLTPKFTVMVWRPFILQVREIVETRSILETRIRQRIAGTAEWICAKFTRKTCLVLRSDERQRQGQSERSRSPPGTKNELCTHNTPAVWTGWNALVADNVAQAAGARFDRCRGVSLPGCVRWAWRAATGICHAFLVVASTFNLTKALLMIKRY